MPLAVVLRLDAETAGFIDAMTACFPERPRSDRDGGYPAHIKLAVFGDTVDSADLDAALPAATGRWKALPVTFARIGISKGSPSIISLIVIPTCDLLARHTALMNALADPPCHPDYEVGASLPDVVVARTHLVADTVEVLLSTRPGSLVGWLDSLDLIQPIRSGY